MQDFSAAPIYREIIALTLGVVPILGACAPKRQGVRSTVTQLPLASAVAPSPSEDVHDYRGKRGANTSIAARAPVDASVDEAGTGAAGAAKRAEACLANPKCPAAIAAGLFVAASDAHDPDLDCFRFIDGSGTYRDLTRGRVCLEHRSREIECGDSSMDLQTAELALMRIDGVGGKADAQGARALLACCFDDATRQAILEHAASKYRDPRTPSANFCKDIGGTTVTTTECMARDNVNLDTARELEAKAVVADLDDTGKDLFAASEAAYADYVAAMGRFDYEVHVQGTIRGIMLLGTEASLKASRVKDLVELPRFVAKKTSSKEVEIARLSSAVALARVSTSTAAEKAALQKTEQTWTVYRDAEVALYEHVFGSTQGANRVRASLLVRLESRRAKECAPQSSLGE